MILDYLPIIAILLAALPAVLFAWNLFIYRRIKIRPSIKPAKVSVLIPARNEEQNIRRTLNSLLASTGVEMEVIALDDHSIDGTAEIVAEISLTDSRLKHAASPPLPPGWCGKQHACYSLAMMATHPLLVFIDADVCLAPDALARMIQFMENRQVDLASGVPRELYSTLSDRLLIPLIHFILLGFLPMQAMRRSRLPAMSAGCGQLFICRADSYRACGGHASLCNSLHDGIKLPRAFRRAGFKTDLFDATDLATCRMYETNAQTWRGLGKNATEALAAPVTIVPMTFLLLGGQVLPFVLFAMTPRLTAAQSGCAAAAVALVLLQRFVSVVTFKQSWLGAFLHPVGVLALLAIQWAALFRQLLGRPTEWKGRQYTKIQFQKVSGIS